MLLSEKIKGEVLSPDFTILTVFDNPSGTTDTTIKPHSVQRNRDGEIFTVGDKVTNSTEMVGNITGFSLLNGKMHVEHTWSGIGMNLDSLIRVKTLFYRQVAKLQFTPEMPPIYVTVRGIHHYGLRTKYDLDLWLGDGTHDEDGYEDPDTGVKMLQKKTRIYNVDADFVKAD